MSITTSLNIVDIITENAGLVKLHTSPETYPTFFTSEMWLQNLQDEAAYPLIYLERPITESGQVLPQGNPKSSYDLNIFLFSGITNQDSLQETIEPLLSSAKDMKRQLVVLFQNDKRINEIKSYSVEEISQTNKLDINACGVWLRISLNVIDNISVC